MKYPSKLIFFEWLECIQSTKIKNRKVIAKKIFQLLHKHLRVYENWPFSDANKQTSYKEKKGKQETFDLNDFRSKSREREKRMWKQTYVSPKLNQMLNSMYHTLANTLSLYHIHTHTHALPCTHTYYTHTHFHALTRTLTNNLSFLLFSDLLPPPTLNGLYVYFLLLTLPFSDNCNIIVYLSVRQTKLLHFRLKIFALSFYIVNI